MYNFPFKTQNNGVQICTGLIELWKNDVRLRYTLSVKFKSRGTHFLKVSFAQKYKVKNITTFRIIW